MGKDTAISWADDSWNPWRGCHPVSPACDNCYARAYAKRFPKQFPDGFGSLVRSTTTFEDPLKWKNPRRIFVCSLSDFFHSKAAAWRTEAFDIIPRASHHTYLLLTKRPLSARTILQYTWGDSPWPNVWLGVTAENQEQADKRIPILLNTPAAKRFVSVEPMLEPVKLSADWHDYLAGWDVELVHVCGGNPDACSQRCPEVEQYQTPPLDWVIVGGESGPNRRHMDSIWLEDIVKQCRDANVPVFVKQGSALRPGQQGDIPDHIWKIKEFPHQNEVKK